MSAARRIAGALLALGLALTPLLAQEPALTRADLDALLAPALEADWCRALAIGIRQGETTLIAGYGQLSSSDPRPPDGNTLFEIGSISKVFTGVLLGEAIARGELELEHPIATLLPEGVALAAPGEAITLHDLSSHHSGLPRMPPGFDYSDWNDGWAAYDLEGLWAELDGLRPAPRGRYDYSNLAAGLLGTLIAEHADRSDDELLQERVTRPLGMLRTRVRLPADELPSFAPGHDVDLAPAPSWDLAALSPAGGIRSSVREMLRFADFVLDPDAHDVPASLAEGLRLAMIPRRAVDDDGLRVGLGWHVTTRQAVWWHNGQTGGYHAMLEVAPGEGLAVVVLANDAGGFGEQIADLLMSRLLGREAPPPSVPRVETAPTSAELRSYAGRYASALGGLIVELEGETLHARLGAQPRFRLWPSGERRFRYRAVDAELTFDPPVDGVVPTLLLYQNGGRVEFKRAPEDAAR